MCQLGDLGAVSGPVGAGGSAVVRGRWHVIGPRAFGAEGRPETGLGGSLGGCCVGGNRVWVGAAGMGCLGASWPHALQ